MMHLDEDLLDRGDLLRKSSWIFLRAFSEEDFGLGPHFPVFSFFFTLDLLLLVLLTLSRVLLRNVTSKLLMAWKFFFTVLAFEHDTSVFRLSSNLKLLG